MKKLLFTLFTISLLVSSCSNDDGSIDNQVEQHQKYSINFDVKSDVFKIAKESLVKDASMQVGRPLFQIVVYKESGEVYSDTLFLSTGINALMKEDGSMPFSLELPKGNYHVAMMYTFVTINTSYYPDESIFRLKPVNFYTDTYGGGFLGSMSGGGNANIGNYYQTIDLSVPATDATAIPIVLEPMWSTATIEVTDTRTFEVPVSAHFITIDLLPSYSDYSISTKDAVLKVDHLTANNNTNFIEISKVRQTDGASVSINLSKTAVENNNMVLNIKYYAKPEPTAVVYEKNIDLNKQLENGQNYNIIGNIGTLDELGGGKMNITYAPFNEDAIIDLPF